MISIKVFVFHIIIVVIKVVFVSFGFSIAKQHGGGVPVMWALGHRDGRVTCLHGQGEWCALHMEEGTAEGPKIKKFARVAAKPSEVWSETWTWSASVAYRLFISRSMIGLNIELDIASQ